MVSLNQHPRTSQDSADQDQQRQLISEQTRAMKDGLIDRGITALAIGAIKHAEGRPIYDPAREEAVLEDISRGDNGPFSAEHIRRVFAVVIDVCREIQEERYGTPTVES